MAGERVRRGFVEIDEGQVHYRYAGEGAGDPCPLVLLHASPGSSKMLAGLMGRFARCRRVIAPDTLGNGDSAPPALDGPPISYFADAHLRALDALGIERFDLYGSHTGGSIACEIAIRAPERVRRLILDGMSLYADDERDDMLAHYAPSLSPDLGGGHVNLVWHFARDSYLFWPWYKRDAAHVRDVGLPSAEALHDRFVEIMKALTTYHQPYRAAIAYPKHARLPLVQTDTLLACARDDMMLPYVEAVAALLARVRIAVTPGSRQPLDADATVATMTAFLDRSEERDTKDAGRGPS